MEAGGAVRRNSYRRFQLSPYSISTISAIGSGCHSPASRRRDSCLRIMRELRKTDLCLPNHLSPLKSLRNGPYRRYVVASIDMYGNLPYNHSRR
jgi:hypothetical protein